MPDSANLRDLAVLEAELKKLEAEYNMFFAGRLPRPPWETRSRVDKLVKRFDRMHISNYGERFRFSTLQARYAAFVDLWERGLRAREEGRQGPFASSRAGVEQPPAPAERVRHVTTFADPTSEAEKLRDLYDSVVAARRELGQEPVAFNRFASLITSQVAKLKQQGSSEIAFRVAVKDGKVNLTARAIREVRADDDRDAAAE